MVHPRKLRRRLFYLIGTYRAARSSLDSFQSDARMSDKIPPAVRSQMMAAVRNKDTAPERAVRTALFSSGYRYRLHRRDLPGSPDIVLPRYRTAVFVHGCFLHRHDCPRGRRPASNVDFWNAKLDRNIARDRERTVALVALGWHVVTIWQCAIDPLGTARSGRGFPCFSLSALLANRSPGFRR
jgi:DNA mismatch endonuclease, patch repair protein